MENRPGKLANFLHFSEFVQQESEEANFLFGLSSLNVKPSTSKVKASSYTTTSFNSSDQGLKPHNRWGECWYCKSNTHRLIDCKEFTKISIEDLFEFIKRTRLCHKCFSSRHRTPQCKKVNSCTVEGCTNPFHHTLLHFTRDPQFPKGQRLKSAILILIIHEKTLLRFLQFQRPPIRMQMYTFV